MEALVAWPLLAGALFKDFHPGDQTSGPSSAEVVGPGEQIGALEGFADFSILNLARQDTVNHQGAFLNSLPIPLRPLVYIGHRA